MSSIDGIEQESAIYVLLGEEDGIEQVNKDLDIVANYWTAQLQAELPKEEVSNGSESKE